MQLGIETNDKRAKAPTAPTKSGGSMVKLRFVLLSRFVLG